MTPTAVCEVSGITIFFLHSTVEAPVLSSDSSTATSISLSWTSAGSEVDSYEVMWQRDTSGECPDEDAGSTTITDNSTSYDIMGLEEDSSYSITVTASNAAGSTISNTITAMTLGLEIETGIEIQPLIYLPFNDHIFPYLQPHLLLPLP